MADMRDNIPAVITGPRDLKRLMFDRETVDTLESALTELDKLVPPTSAWGDKIIAWRNVLLEELATLRGAPSASAQGSLF